MAAAPGGYLLTMPTVSQRKRQKIDYWVQIISLGVALTVIGHCLWVTLVDYATAHTHTDIRFTFKDGTEISAG